MSKLYTFVIPFSGTMSVWLEADSEDEARQNVMNGNWWDSNEETFESHPDQGLVLVQVEDVDEESD
jgi:SLT domain-containing protein